MFAAANENEYSRNSKVTKLRVRPDDDVKGWQGVQTASIGMFLIRGYWLWDSVKFLGLQTPFRLDNAVVSINEKR